MQQQLSELYIYVKGTFKHKWLAISLAWVLCLVGWALVMSLPNKYTSTAKVHVDSSTLLQPLLKDIAIQQDGRKLVRVMKQLMFTTPNLDKIIALSNLDASVRDEIEKVELYKDMREDIIIKGKGFNKDGLFEIEYEARNPSLAKNVVNAVLTVFSEQTQKSTLEDVSSSQRFIAKQIREYEVRLRNAEKAREAFKRANFGLLPEVGEGNMSKLQVAYEQLENAKLLLSEATSKRNVLASQMREVKQSGDTWKSNASILNLSPEDQRIKELRQRKINLMLKYTESHPAVHSVDILLQQAIKVKNKLALERSNSNIPNAGVMSNPFVQQLVIFLNEAQSEVASNRARVNVLKDRIERYKGQLDTRLTVETELQNLNRDYNTINNNYQKLVERREQARMSEKVDLETVTIKFKIADPPNMPLKPSGPKRLLLIPTILIFGLMCGFGLSFFLFYSKPTYMTTNQLREITGLPVLGNITRQTIGLTKIHETNFAYIFTVFSLFLAFFTLLAFEFIRMNKINLF